MQKSASSTENGLHLPLIFSHYLKDVKSWMKLQVIANFLDSNQTTKIYPWSLHGTVRVFAKCVECAEKGT
jgi:hypothetical protein